MGISGVGDALAASASSIASGSLQSEAQSANSAGSGLLKSTALQGNMALQLIQSAAQTGAASAGAGHIDVYA